MYRFDRIDSPTMPRDDATATPSLTSSAQSPQSSSLPSANTSTVDEPVHSTTIVEKSETTTLNGGVQIQEGTS